MRKHTRKALFIASVAVASCLLIAFSTYVTAWMCDRGHRAGKAVTGVIWNDAHTTSNERFADSEVIHRGSIVIESRWPVGYTDEDIQAAEDRRKAQADLALLPVAASWNAKGLDGSKALQVDYGSIATFEVGFPFKWLVFGITSRTHQVGILNMSEGNLIDRQVSIRYRELGLNFLAFAVGATLVIFGATRIRWRTPPGLCPKCRYPTLDQAALCPECGSVYKQRLDS